MHIVLLEPEIPHNTGAIGRTCHATGSTLHLIRPLGFSVDERAVQRSGLDYWKELDVRIYDDFEHFLRENQGARLFMATTKARHSYTDVVYREDDYIVFGRESRGLPEELLLQYPDSAIRIPMKPEMRSLNLSVSAGIILYEALRQTGFETLATKGQLHRHTWDETEHRIL